VFIYENGFKKDRDICIAKYYHKHLMAYRIQNYWRNARVNPNTQIGWNKGNKDYDELIKT
jgi:hypothetical protein